MSAENVREKHCFPIALFLVSLFGCTHEKGDPTLPYAFANGMKNYQVSPSVTPGVLSEVWDLHRPFDEVVKQAELELAPDGWSERKHRDTDTAFKKGPLLIILSRSRLSPQARQEDADVSHWTSVGIVGRPAP